MTMFADCRNDGYYNEDFLSKEDKEYLNGFDYCLETVKNLFENNLDTYAGEIEYDGDIDIDKVLEKAKESITEMVENWVEMERDMMITSMIESLDDAEYKANRKKAYADNPDKEYYDTRKFICTGKKEKIEVDAE